MSDNISTVGVIVWREDWAVGNNISTVGIVVRREDRTMRDGRKH